MSLSEDEVIVKISYANKDQFFGNKETPGTSLSLKADKLILTNKQFICIRKGFFDRKDYSKKESIEKGLKNKNSFSIPLKNIVNAKAFRLKLTDCLLFYRQINGDMKPYLFTSWNHDPIIGVNLTTDMLPWVEAIEKAKKEL